jgi:hypothetical protein
VTSPFDRLPRLPGFRFGGLDERSWFDAWADLTTWWVEPAVVAVQLFPAQAEELLAQLIEGVAARFEGGRVELAIRDHSVVATLDSLRLFRRRDRRELRIELSDTEVGGLPFETLGIAASVRLEPGVEPTFVATDIEVDGLSPLSPLVGWLDGRSREWSLDVADDEVLARRRAGHTTFVVAPFVRMNTVHLELRGVRWRGLHAAFPRWLRVERTYALVLEPGWALVETGRDDSHIRFRLRGRQIEQRLDAKHLRDAIVRGAQLSF